jgi:hypothetical protein
LKELLKIYRAIFHGISSRVLRQQDFQRWMKAVQLTCDLPIPQSLGLSK